MVFFHISSLDNSPVASVTSYNRTITPSSNLSINPYIMPPVKSPKNPVSKSPGLGYKVLHGIDFAAGAKGLYDASKMFYNRIAPAIRDAAEIAEPGELAPLMAGEIGLEELPLLAVL